MSKLAKYRKRRSTPKRNPPIGVDLVQFILPGFAAFAATRLGTKLVTAQIAKRWPKVARHAGAIASVGSFAAAWYGAHKVKYLDRYHDSIVVGSGLAALQNLVQLYLPKIGEMLGDPMPALPAAKEQPLLQSQQTQVADYEPTAARIPAGFRPTTANEWYTYNDSFDAGGYKGKAEGSQSPTPGQAQPATSEPDEMQITDLLDNSDLVDSDLGSFS